MERNKKMANEKVKISAFLVQGLATLSIAYLTTLSGYILAFTSYTLENFTSNETVLSHPMSSTEVSILGSINNIGGLAITPFCGFIVNSLGRKYSVMLFGLPFVVAWLLMAFTTSVYLLIAAFGLAGIGAAGQAISSVYICEIAQDSIRGGLASTTVSGFFVGLLFSYFLGGQLTYYQVTYTFLALSVLYIVMLMFLKESPVFLVQKGKIEEAAKSIAFYRRVDVTSKEVEVELNKIRLQLDPRIDMILQGEYDSNVTKKLIDGKQTVKDRVKESSWQFLKKSESTKRALVTVLTVMAANIMMGSIVILVYAEPLFKEAVPSMPPNLCSILLAIDFMCGSLICASIVDRFGRKFLMTYSSAATGVFTVLLGIQLQLHFAPHWFTALLIYAYCFVYNLGAATVPFILNAEVFLPEARGLCSSMVMGCMWITNFVILIIFNPLVESFGLGPLYYGFTVVCFLTALYSQFYLPETKGLSVDAIQLLFLKERQFQNNKA